MFKIYLEATTEELITETNLELKARPKFSELYRMKNKERETLTITSQHNFNFQTEFVCRDLHWSNAQDVNGDPYADFQAFWDALTPFFSV